jgi:hypothetical protein
MFESSKMIEKCLVCGAPAEWIRCTQFAGDHPYCEHHARKEDDFGTDDSYEFWKKLEPHSWDNWKPNKDLR